MKNFKLLLATTAILSTGLTANVWATSAEYTDEGIDIPVTVGLISTIKYEVTQDLDFGIAMVKPGDTITIPANTGLVATDNAVILKTGVRGYVDINGVNDFPGNISLVFPDSEHPLILKSGSGENTITCGEVSDFSQNIDAAGAYNKGIYVGGTFTVDNYIDISDTHVTNCTGTLTVTLLHN